MRYSIQVHANGPASYHWGRFKLVRGKSNLYSDLTPSEKTHLVEFCDVVELDEPLPSPTPSKVALSLESDEGPTSKLDEPSALVEEGIVPALSAALATEKKPVGRPKKPREVVE